MDDLRQRAVRARRGSPRFGLFLCLLGAVALVLGASRYVQMPAWHRSASPLAQTCATLLDALRTGNPNVALAVSVDNPARRELVRQDDERLFQSDAVEAASNKAGDPAPRLSVSEFLQAAHKDLSRQGVACDSLAPLAFGGVEARVMDPARMRKPAVSVMGEFYFDAAGSVYALEFTARRCGSEYTVTDLWKCAPVAAGPHELEARSQARFKEFKRDAAELDGGVRISRARRVFVTLR